ncbi:MAG: hypothetical protein JWP36_2037 [Paucimonas sp.]|nr:hypothetical protein [Paucimonas sp.]
MLRILPERALGNEGLRCFMAAKPPPDNNKPCAACIPAGTCIFDNSLGALPGPIAGPDHNRIEQERL